MSDNRRFPNLFWPVLLIGVGILLFLSNLGYIETVSFYHLWRLWPLLLVALGIHIMFGRRLTWVSNLISLGLVALVIGFLIFAPSLGFSTPSGELVSEQFSAELGSATSADFDIDLDRGNLNIYLLEDSRNLTQVDVTRSKDGDEFSFSAHGETNKTININLDHIDIDFMFGGWIESQSVTVDVGIAPNIPITLNIDTGSSSTKLDLTGIKIDKVDADTGSGSINLIAPSGDYPIDLGAGSGTLTIQLAPNTTVNLEAGVGSGTIKLTLAEGVSGNVKLESGSGTITVRAPDSVGVEVSGTTGSGGVYLPGDYVRTRGQDVPGPSDSGTWESPNFDTATDKIYIRFGVGSGSFRVQED